MSSLQDSMDEIKDEINQLIFSKDSPTYKFNSSDFDEIGDIDYSCHIVKHLVYRELNLHLAVKLINLSPCRFEEDAYQRKLQKISSEIKHLRALSDCSNIVQLYGIGLHANQLWICMELMDLSLHDFYILVHKVRNRMDEDILGFIAIEILEALRYCKTKNIIHRDIKPKNILLNRKGEVKLCDFGESRFLEDSLASSFVGTIAYWPLERFNIETDVYHYDIRSDIWSFGITMIEIANGSYPFTKNDKGTIKMPNIVEVQKIIMSTNMNELIHMLLTENYSKNFCDFVSQCVLKLEVRPKNYNTLMEWPFYAEHKLKKGKSSTLLTILINETMKENIFMHDKNLSFYDNLRQNPVINQIKFLDDNKVYRFDINDFEQISDISRKVGRYRHKPSNKEMAIKIVSTSNNHNAMGEINKQIINSLVKEIPSFYDLQNESNIVQFYGLGVCEERVLICMELMDMSLKELCNTIHRAQLPFPEKLLGCLVVAVINALISCKICDVIHAIKSDNIFINKKHQIKLSCFDSSRFSEAIFESINAKENLEFMYYWPFEKFQADVEQTDYKADIWSLGITLCELAFGVIPFLFDKKNYPAIKDISVLKYNLETLNTVKLILETFSPKRYSEDLREFVKLCLLPVDKRPRYNLLMKTTFYRTYAFSSFEDDNQVFKCIQDIEARLGKEF